MAKNVLGKAVYLELVNGFYTSQAVFFPAVTTPSGRVPAMIMTRRISADNPRRQWRFSRGSDKGIHPGTPVTEREALLRVQPDIEWAAPMLSGYALGGWKLVGGPLAVEVTDEDYLDINTVKTPAAFLRRVTRARTVAGFPSDIIVSK